MKAIIRRLCRLEEVSRVVREQEEPSLVVERHSAALEVSPNICEARAPQPLVPNARPGGHRYLVHIVPPGSTRITHKRRRARLSGRRVTWRVPLAGRGTTRLCNLPERLMPYRERPVSGPRRGYFGGEPSEPARRLFPSVHRHLMEQVR
jgi:hypothetical protein